MDHRQTERIGRAASAQSRAAWIRPQVDRFNAGGAEAGPSGDVDGADTLS
ncbi:MAG TPA: hypothetical protein VF574_03350 [Allosphingosinicella sp.]